MPSSNRWGRWLLEGEHLVYEADAGAIDPCYEVHTAQIERADELDDLVDHLRSKTWITEEDLADLRTASLSVMNARLFDEAYLHVPQPLSPAEYAEYITQEWNRLLSGGEANNEGRFQRFLEDHPCFLPGPYGTHNGRWHGLLFDAVIAQPELPGICAKRPDFLLFDQDSATTYAVLIEIEAPGKPWATRNGTPTAQLTQAIDQLRSWKVWFADPRNNLAFQRLYNLDVESTYRTFVQHYILIYGRREEANRLESFASKRHHLAGEDEFFMTYDRLVPHGFDEVTVKLDRSGPDTRLRLVSVPATFTLNQAKAFSFSRFIGREEAISRNPLISDERKKFLIDRIRAADAWAGKEPRRGA